MRGGFSPWKSPRGSPVEDSAAARGCTGTATNRLIVRTKYVTSIRSRCSAPLCERNRRVNLSSGICPRGASTTRFKALSLSLRSPSRLRSHPTGTIRRHTIVLTVASWPSSRAGSGGGAVSTELCHHPVTVRSLVAANLSAGMMRPQSAESRWPSDRRVRLEHRTHSSEARLFR